MKIIIPIFQKNKNPIVFLKLSFFITSGIAPSKAPAGQIHLQKYGAASPNLLVKNMGSKITNTKSIRYFKYLKGLSITLGILNFLVGILYNRSCINPKGHIRPHTSLPNKAPINIIIPST